MGFRDGVRVPSMSNTNFLVKFFRSSEYNHREDRPYDSYLNILSLRQSLHYLEFLFVCIPKPI